MDVLKLRMKLHNVLEADFVLRVVRIYQFFHEFVDFLRLSSIVTAHYVGAFLVVSDRKPREG